MTITRLDHGKEKKASKKEKTAEKHDSDSDDTIIYNLGSVVKSKVTKENPTKR